jgi:hypothetical protein
MDIGAVGMFASLMPLHCCSGIFGVTVGDAYVG